MPIVNASTEQTTGAIILTFSTKNFRTTANVINRRSIILILTIAIVIMFLAFGYSVLITRPLQRVTESIDDIAAGDMDTKLDAVSYTHLVPPDTPDRNWSEFCCSIRMQRLYGMVHAPM